MNVRYAKWFAIKKFWSRNSAHFPKLTILREAGWLVSGVALKMIFQIGTLYYLTRSLGVEYVGVFFAVISLFALVVPFVQLGNYDLTVRQIARGEHPPLVAGRAMRSSVASFAIVLPVVLALKPWLMGQVSWISFLAMACSEMLILRVLTNVIAVATGFRLHYVSAASDMLMGLSKFTAIYIAAWFGFGVDGVLIMYALTSVPTTLGAYIWLVQRTGRPTMRSGPVFADLLDHITMVLAWFSEMFARDGDKLVLTVISNSIQTGIYGTASRIFAITLVPIDILTQVFRPRLSQARAKSKEAGTSLWAIMAGCLCSCGVITGVALFVGAYFLPLVAPDLIKSDFAEVRSALMYLAFVPPLYGLQRANVIDAIARGAVRAYAIGTTIGAVCGMGSLMILAPSYGWRGACIGSIIYFAVSALATWLLSRNLLGILPVANEGWSDAAPLPNPLLNESLEVSEL